MVGRGEKKDNVWCSLSERTLSLIRPLLPTQAKAGSDDDEEDSDASGGKRKRGGKGKGKGKKKKKVRGCGSVSGYGGGLALVTLHAHSSRVCHPFDRQDPNAPKRAMSAFMLFSNAKRAEVKAQNPELKVRWVCVLDVGGINVCGCQRLGLAWV